MTKQCPKCGENLNEKSYCAHCGITFHSYHRIEQLAKMYYNEGLSRAQIRDLSGAIEILNKSLRYDKRNTDARNLLGLAYFEVGEIVSALREWVISRNMMPEGNLANDYLGQIQKNQVNLEYLDSTIKKYNQALRHIDQNSSDLAIIQLKKILSMNPRFVKAYCLLALLYAQEGEKGKAKKELIKALAIDKTNYLAIKYYSALSETDEENPNPVTEEATKLEEPVKVKPIKVNQSLQQFLGIAFGLILGVAVFYFLVSPYVSGNQEDTIAQQEKELTANESTIQELQDSSTDYQEQIAELKSQLDQLNSENNLLTNQTAIVDDMMLSVSSYMDDDYETAASYLEDIDASQGMDDAVSEVYNSLTSIIFPQVAQTKYSEGYSAYNRNDYETAIAAFTESLELSPNESFSDNAVYYLGRSYQKDGQTEKAIEAFNNLIENYPNSSNLTWAQGQLQSLGQ